MNWTFFVTVQSVVMFRRTLMDLWKRTAYFIASTVSGICSSVILVITLLLGIAFVFGKEGSLYLSEYEANHVFPLVSIVCMEFAEIIAVIFKFYMVKQTSLDEIKTSKVEFFIDEIKTQVTLFKKPNLAMLQ